MNYLTKTLLVAACVLGSWNASADQCLQNASNEALLAESSRRMAGGDQGGNGGSEGVMISFACEYYNGYDTRFSVLLTDLETATETRTQLNVINKDECSRYSAGLNSKYQF